MANFETPPGLTKTPPGLIDNPAFEKGLPNYHATGRLDSDANIAVAVPEPSSFLLLGVALVTVALFRHWRRIKASLTQSS